MRRLLAGLPAVLALTVLSASFVAASAPATRASGMEIRYMERTIEHHSMGVAMAIVCVEQAAHDDLRELCAKAAADQVAEIELLQGWLLAWYGVTADAELSQNAQRMLAELSSLSGADFEIELLTTFSRHHAQVVNFSRHVAIQAPHRDLRRVAQHVIVEQGMEIAQMRGWLCSWYDTCRGNLG